MTRCCSFFFFEYRSLRMEKVHKLAEEVGTLKTRLSEEIVARCNSDDLVDSLRRQLSTKTYELSAKEVRQFPRAERIPSR